jgi:uncharacterized membrane protein
LAFYALLVLVCLAPLPFGSVQIWAWSLTGVAVGLLTAVWAASVARGRGPDLHGIDRLRWPLLGVAAVAAWVGVQIGTATPEGWHHPVWRIAGDSLGVPLPGRIAIDPQAGLFALLRLLTYAAVFWLACQYARDQRKARLALHALAVAIAATASLGLVLWGLRVDSFLWFDEATVAQQTRHGVRLSLPFVNPNHLASFAGIGLIAVAGLLAGEAKGLWRPETPAGEKLRRFLEAVVTRRWYLLVAGLLLTAALVLSASRGGVLATVLGLLTLAAALARRRPRVVRLAAAGAVVLVALIVMFGSGIGRVADRIASADLASEQRLPLYAATLRLIGDSPWLGYGYGSFPALYRMIDQRDLTMTVDAAHSTLLENTAELGVPAALVLFASILMPVVWCWRGARIRRRDRHIPATASAVAVAGLAHSLVDFPLQIPALALLLAFVLGLGVAQSRSSRDAAPPTPPEV